MDGLVNSRSKTLEQRRAALAASTQAWRDIDDYLTIAVDANTDKRTAQDALQEARTLIIAHNVDARYEPAKRKYNDTLRVVHDKYWMPLREISQLDLIDFFFE